MKNTLKTTIGFLQSWISRRLPGAKTSETIQEIYNYLDIENLYTTSGQPSELEFGLIKDQGYEVVINLAPQSTLENSVIEEATILEKLGIEYVHIPVNFQKPSERKYEMFLTALSHHNDKKIWVHCAANMRVSAFTYRYRVQELGIAESDANSDLQTIWDPIGVWKQFVLRKRQNPN